MVNKIIITVSLLLIVVFSGCLLPGAEEAEPTTGPSDEFTPVCDPPYILEGSSCCLDANSNGVCDIDEAPITTVPVTAAPTAAPTTMAAVTTTAPMIITTTLMITTTTVQVTTTKSTSTTSTTSTTTTTVPQTPPPPNISKTANLAAYMVAIPGYEQTRLGPEDICDLLLCDMGAKYTKQPILVGRDRSIFVEFYIQPNSAAALSWMREKQFANQT